LCNLHLDTADERIGWIGDDTIGRRDTASDFDRLAEIPTDLNFSQFDHPLELTTALADLPRETPTYGGQRSNLSFAAPAANRTSP